MAHVVLAESAWYVWADSKTGRVIIGPERLGRPWEEEVKAQRDQFTVLIETDRLLVTTDFGGEPTLVVMWRGD